MNQLIEFYGNNDYRDYLAHHGIMGMSWGHRNGPPYPLAYGDHSAAEKKAGWRQSLSSSGRADLKRKWKSKERADFDGNSRARYSGRDDEDKERDKRLGEASNRIADATTTSNNRELDRATNDSKKAIAADNDGDARSAPAKKTLSEVLAARKQKAIDNKKRAIADRAVNSTNMSELMKAKNNKLFSAEEINSIADRVDTRASALNRMSARSNIVEGLFGKNRQSALDKAKASEILKNSDRYTTEEIQAATEKFAAKQKLKNAQRDARLNGIKSLVEKGAAITKGVADITANVKTAKTAFEEITGKKLPGASDAINKILNSGDRNRINELSKTVEFDADKYKKAASSIKAKDDYDKLFQANQRANESSQGKQQKQDSSKDQKIADTNVKIQNESKPEAPKQESGSSNSAYDRMMDSWRSAKVDGSSKTPSTSEEFAATRMERMAGAMRAGSKNSDSISKAMDSEIAKYTQMTSGRAGKKLAKAISSISSSKVDSFLDEVAVKNRRREAAEKSTQELADNVRSLQSLTGRTVKAEPTTREESYSKLQDRIREMTSSSNVDRKAANRRAGAKKAAETRANNKAAKESTWEDVDSSAGLSRFLSLTSSVRESAAKEKTEAALERISRGSLVWDPEKKQFVKKG